MTLEWKGAPGNVIARGERGLYTIQSLISDHILQGIDNDGNRMRQFGFLGKSFAQLDDAKAAAQEADTPNLLDGMNCQTPRCGQPIEPVPNGYRSPTGYRHTESGRVCCFDVYKPEFATPPAEQVAQ